MKKKTQGYVCVLLLKAEEGIHMFPLVENEMTS